MATKTYRYIINTEQENDNGRPVVSEDKDEE